MAAPDVRLRRPAPRGVRHLPPRARQPPPPAEEHPLAPRLPGTAKPADRATPADDAARGLVLLGDLFLGGPREGELGRRARNGLRDEEGAVVAGMQRAGWAVRAGEPFRLSADPAIRITAASLDPADAGRVAAELAALLAPSATRPACACTNHEVVALSPGSPVNHSAFLAGV